MGPPPADPIHSIPKTPAIHLLTAAIINSLDRLFFVSHSIGANTSDDPTRIHTLCKYVGQVEDKTSIETAIAKQ